MLRCSSILAAVAVRARGDRVQPGGFSALAFGNDVEISPKKAYVSFRRKKQFAIIQPSVKTRLDVGLNLKGVAPDSTLEAAGTWNSMCSHRAKIEEEKTINEDLFRWIREAYEQAG